MSYTNPIVFIIFILEKTKRLKREQKRCKRRAWIIIRLDRPRNRRQTGILRKHLAFIIAKDEGQDKKVDNLKNCIITKNHLDKKVIKMIFLMNVYLITDINKDIN